MNDDTNIQGARLTHHSLRVWGEALALVRITKAAGIRDAVVRDQAHRSRCGGCVGGWCRGCARPDAVGRRKSLRGDPRMEDTTTGVS